MPEPNRQGVTGTVIVLIVALVLYVLSSGPAIWLIGRSGFPEYLLVPYEVIYKPLELAQRALPGQITVPLDRYIAWWMAEFMSPAASAYPPTSTSPLPTTESDEPEAGPAGAGE